MRARRWGLSLVLSGLVAGAGAEAPPQVVMGPTETAPAAVAVLPADPLAAGVAPVPFVPPSFGDPELDQAAQALLLAFAPEPEPAPPQPLDPARVLPRASKLGIPPKPADPERRTRFSVPADDPAGVAARAIARRVSMFKNFRAEVPGSVWLEDAEARFAIRAQARCLEQLAKLGVPAQLVERPLITPVPAPVVLTGAVGGVAFVSLYPDRPVEVSCELAARLPALARILRKHGVRAVGVSSSYRESPRVSFHTFGLALDLAAFRTKRRTLVVARHFEVTPDVHTCDAEPATEEGKALLSLVCELVESHLFSSVLTPNYNEGHKDHLHVDLRPDDPRLFVR
jgi:hypothetical protein